ncbi:hypothetical protein ACWELB_17540 [Streptomyces asiaticus]
MAKLTERRVRDRRQAILEAATALFAQRGDPDDSTPVPLTEAN